LICFSLAFPSRRKTEKSGSHVGFISVELWGKTAELYFPLLEKGLAVCITGELVHQRWVSVDGKKMQKFLISAQTLAISDPKFRAVA
ncbi:MAG: single-stranded DNA-binding protein, partial [Turneriella sp.]|nr:single-stranded DNA-binding protein [Turneriella sp.]